MIKVSKPWGYELILTPSWLPFTVKVAFTKAGSRWSLQYHEEKTEIIILIKGKGNFILEDKERGSRFCFIRPLQRHRFCAKTNCFTFELSTPEKGKTVRIEDDYRRGDETEKDRIKKMRRFYGTV